MSFTIKCNECGKRNTFEKEDDIYDVKAIYIHSDNDHMVGIWCPRCSNEIGGEAE